MEEWRDIRGFPGYQVSNQGRVRSFWRKKHYPTGYGSYNYLCDTPVIMSTSDDGNGYRKLILYNKESGRRCKKIHRLVAEAFIPCDIKGDVTVDHIRSGPIGKLDNSVSNLRWISRRDNIRKAYADGMCDERIARSRKMIVITDLWTNKEFYFNSVGEAASELGLNQTSISHVLAGDINKIKHYTAEYADREDRLLYGNDDYQADQRFSWL